MIDEPLVSFCSSVRVFDSDTRLVKEVERRQVRAAAKPRFGRDDEPRVHVHGRHVRIPGMDDERYAGRPETGVFVRAGYLLGELGRKRAVNRRGVNASLLEDPAM